MYPAAAPFRWYYLSSWLRRKILVHPQEQQRERRLAPIATGIGEQRKASLLYLVDADQLHMKAFDWIQIAAVIRYSILKRESRRRS
jgi:hypothetical protein